jgi:hypothetical protein
MRQMKIPDFDRKKEYFFFYIFLHLLLTNVN